MNSNQPRATKPGTTAAGISANFTYSQEQARNTPLSKNGKGNRAVKGILITLGIILLLSAASLAVVFPKSRQFVVELGEKVPISPTDYLFGYPFVVDRAVIDVGSVNTGKVGDYTGTVRLLFYNYTLDISVVDTTPPEIIPFAEELYIATGREYGPEDFADQIRDVSGDVNCHILYEGSRREQISFPSAGQYELYLEAVDASGNVGTREVLFTVVDPPEIIGAFDRHLPIGTNFDVTRAAAVDTGDGNITDRLKVDAGDFDPRREGDYTVTYSVSDSHGLVTEKSVTLSVCSRQKLSLYRENISLSQDEMKLLCDAGYFAYKPLDTPDYFKAVNLIEPTLVNFKQVRSNGYAAGSGCIYRITPEYIYLLSVKHVMEEVHRDCRIMFFDGNVVTENIDYATPQNSNELSLCRIPTSVIPAETMLSLRQVYVDRAIYSKLSKGDEVIAYAKHWSGTDRDYIRRMKVKRLSASISEFGLYNSLLETTEGVVNGMSGTAVIDLRGRLAGLASAFGTATDSKYAVSAYHSRIDVLDQAEAALEAKKFDNAA